MRATVHCAHSDYSHVGVGVGALTPDHKELCAISLVCSVRVLACRR